MGIFDFFSNMLSRKPVRTYDVVPDEWQESDLLYADFNAFPKQVPLKTDLRPLMPPVYDQGQLGSCVGNGLAAAVAAMDYKNGRPDPQLSRLFIYWIGRHVEGTEKSDSGVQIRDAVKALAALGACAEADWPYDIKKFSVEPPEELFAKALPNKISAYYRVMSPIEVKECLAEGYPVVVGINVYSSFESSQTAKTGVMPMPDIAHEKFIGGHCILIVGYDNTTGQFICRNSWGADWGIHGYFLMPYSFMSVAGNVTDMWTIRR